MKRTFSREYWFLLGGWLAFVLLSIGAGAAADWVREGGAALDRFQDAPEAANWITSALDALSSAFGALSGAALGIVAIRYWVGPCALIFSLHTIRILASSLPAAVSGGAPVVLGMIAALALTLVMLFGLSKFFYLLFRGREGAVVLAMLLLPFLLKTVWILVAWETPAGVDLNCGGEILERAKEALLSGAAYALLYLCLRSRRLQGEPAVSNHEE